jgi:PLP dependent protein
VAPITGNYTNIISKLPGEVKLVAITKTISAEYILELYNAGHRMFGENKVQELTAKVPGLPDDIQWHLVGHLQTNKVKYLAPFISMIESVDSLKLLSVINKEAVKNNRVIDCLLQVHIALEETKFGLSEAEVVELLSNQEFTGLKNVRVCGLMGMATFTDNMDVVRKEFRGLKAFFDSVKIRFFEGKDYFRELSMGMSGDYLIAIEEGATMVRIGSLIFGERIYS